MATEAAPSTVNGTYHPHHPVNPYPAELYASHPASTVPAHPHQPTHSSTPSTAQTEPKNEVPKEEVAWFFVEQYYTTLSRNPEKLHLFYSRRSQFVSGVEAEKVTVAAGQKDINERIKKLDFQDCKVRVLNVDSQSSFDNILVCVIGEISNKSEPPRKFVQTFVLAEQQNGYYVLNDIIRYLNDEEEELVGEEAAPETTAVEPVAEPAPEKAAPEQAETERQADTEAAAHEVDQKLEETVEKAEEDKTPEAASVPTETPAAIAPEASVPASLAAPEALEVETPKEPEPSPQKIATPAPEKENVPPAKAAPMSWASIASAKSAAAAAAAVATPVAQPAPASQPKPTPAAARPTSQPKSPAPVSADTAAAQSTSSNDSEWQTAGGERGGRQARPQSISGPEEKVLAYIKNVNEKVDASLLKQTLSKFGKLKYFNVNRQQSCAFVEFADTAGYKAAMAANPLQIGGEKISVEERRPRPNAYGGNVGGYPSGRGGPGRGRGDRAGGQGRGGFQKESGRFTPRGGRGGGSITPKGRPQSQAA